MASSEREMAKKFIKWSREDNTSGKYRANDHLFIVLLLAYYCHVGVEKAHELTPGSFYENEDGSAEGHVPTDIEPDFDFAFIAKPAVYSEIKRYIGKYQIKRDGKLIQVSSRQIRKAFGKIADAYGVKWEPRYVYFVGRANAPDGFYHEDFPFLYYDIPEDPYKEDVF